MRILDALLLTSLTALSLPGITGEIYQWKDKSGQTVYSDNPPAGNVPARTIRGGAAVETPSAPEAATPGKSLPDREVEARKRQAEQADKQAKSDKETADAAARKQNCETARNQLTALESGQRVSRFNAQGEREYLDDAQRAAEVERTQKIVADSCK